jgi:hypothetical protein
VSCKILSPKGKPSTVSNESKTSNEAVRNGENPSTPNPPSPHYPEEERVHFTLGLTTAPVIGVLLLLASTSIGGQVLRNGIVGIQGVKPYDIMTLFISLVSSISYLITPISYSRD